MGRQERILAWVLGGLIVLAVAVEILAPRPVDWTDTYEADDSRPYGSEVVYTMLPHLFPSAQVEPVEVAPYQWLRDLDEHPDAENSAYLFITTTFHPDEAEAERLLDYVAEGGHLFVAARSIEGPIADSLHLETSYTPPPNLFSENRVGAPVPKPTPVALAVGGLAATPAFVPDTAGVTVEDSAAGNATAENPTAENLTGTDVCTPPEAEEGYTLILPRWLQRTGTPLKFVNPRLPQTLYCFESNAPYLADFDTSRTTILGTTTTMPDTLRGRPTFVRVPFGEGKVWVSTTPRMFTNYHALRPETTPYVEAALSHLPPELSTVWWDARHKPLVNRAETPLRFVFSEPALRTGYYIMLATVLLFVVVQGRRRQRPVPIMEPPENDTLEFVRVVGKLYHRQQDHADLARKKTAHFMAHIRRRYRVHLDTGASDRDVQQVAERSGVPRPVVERAWAAVQQARTHDTLSADELSAINARIDAFYEQARA